MGNLLDSASIVLTPTAYDNGKMLSVKPSVALGPELVTNGDFATDSDWAKESGWTISGGSANCLNGQGVSIYQTNVLDIGKHYKLTFTVSNYSQGYLGSIAADFGGVVAEANGSYEIFGTATSTTFGFSAFGNFIGSIDNVSVKEDISGDFDFSRNSAATRVNAQGLVENVQILSGDLVSNGDFSQEGAEEISNGSFSQEGAELVTNGDFATDSDWTLQGGWSIANGKLTANNATGYAFQSGVFESGVSKTYKINLSVSDYVSGYFTILTSGGTSQSQQFNANGDYTIYFDSNSPSGATLHFSYFGSFTGSIDNVSVKEVGQDWTLQDGWSIGEDKAVSDGTVNKGVIQENIFTIGKTYKITFDVDVTSGTLSSRIRFYGGGATTIANISSSGSYTFYQEADRDGLQYIMLSSNTATASITNISVKEVGQDWHEKSGVIVSVDSSGLVFDNSTGNGQAGVFQNIGLSDGKKYRMTATMQLLTGASNGNFALQTSTATGSGQSLVYLGETLVVGGDAVTETFDFTPASGDVSVQLSCFEANATFKISNISVVEITDDTNLPRINYEGFSYQDVLGSELLTNGDFATNIDGWSGNTTKTWNDGTLVSAGTGAANNTNIQTLILTAGKTYRFTWEIVSTDGNASFVYSSSEGQITNSYVGAGTFTEDVTIVSNSNYVDFRFTGANTTTVFNSVSVKEVLGQEVVPDSGCGSWLLEPQSTNLLPYSEDFSQWGTIGSPTITSNFGISPDGTQNSTRIQFNNSDRIYKDVSVSGDITYSVYLKGVGQVRLRDNANIYILDITLTDQWVRYEYSFNGTITNVQIQQSVGTSDLEVWGAQVEQQSYATSYIPTNGAISTRLQDIANNSGNATLINSTEGVLYAEIAALANDGTNRAISLIKDNNNTISLFYFLTSNTIRALILNSGSTQVQIDFALSDTTDFNKIAFKYKENDVALYVNGIQVGTDATATIPADLNSLDFKYASNNFHGKVKALAVYKEALTDEQLTCLTTI